MANNKGQQLTLGRKYEINYKIIFIAATAIFVWF